MMNLMWFDDNEGNVVKYTGGKGASLSKMHKCKLNVPNGFVITAPFFFDYRKNNNLDEKIIGLIEHIDYEDCHDLEEVCKKIRKMIVDMPMPNDIEQEIISYYNELGEDSQYVAVRSSSTAEDLDEASFAGQQETFLYVKGKEDLIQKIKECWASLYNGCAVFYRKEKGFSEKDVSIAVVIQKMVNSEKAGVMFTVNPVTRNSDHVLIEAAWGLGEGVVSGTVTPDSYTTDKNTREIVDEYISEKETMFVKDASLLGVCEIEVPEDKKCERVLTDEELAQLTELAAKIEAYYGKPIDIEWAFENGELYVLQSRPITTLETYCLSDA